MPLLLEKGKEKMIGDTGFTLLRLDPGGSSNDRAKNSFPQINAEPFHNGISRTVLSIAFAT